MVMLHMLSTSHELLGVSIKLNASDEAVNEREERILIQKVIFHLNIQEKAPEGQVTAGKSV